RTGRSVGIGKFTPIRGQVAVRYGRRERAATGDPMYMTRQGRRIAVVGLLTILCCQGARAGDAPEGPVDDSRDLRPVGARWLQPNGRFERARLPDDGLPGASQFVPVSAASTTQPSRAARSVAANAPDEQVVKGLVAELGS